MRLIFGMQFIEISRGKIKRVRLAGSTAGDDAMEICGQFAEEIRDSALSTYRQIMFHAAALKDLENYEGVLFIEKKGESCKGLIFIQQHW